MFTTTPTHNHGHTIRRADRPDNRLDVDNVADIYRLRATLDTLLATLLDDAPTVAPAPSQPAMISAVTARAIAHRRGVEINPSTLHMALSRDNIPGAHKRGGRWYLPEDAFLVWLDSFTPRT